MAINTFGTLKQAIADWTHRTNLTPYLDDFVRMAESRIFSDLKVKEMEARTTYTPTTRYLATPARMTSIRRVVAKTATPRELLSTSPDGIHALYSTSTGTPSHYAIIGSEIEFNRVPNIDMEIVYYAAPVALSDAATTNDVLAAYPDVYLAACMVEAGGFIKDAAMTAAWADRYTDALSRANRKSSRFHTGGPMAMVRG